MTPDLLQYYAEWDGAQPRLATFEDADPPDDSWTTSRSCQWYYQFHPNVRVPNKHQESMRQTEGHAALQALANSRKDTS